MKSPISQVAFFALPFALVACTPTIDDPSSESTNLGASCSGGSSTIPDDGRYSLTTFGGPGDSQGLGCGGSTTTSTWYVASAQRFGCHAKLQLTAGGHCVVAEVLDCGPAAWVEQKAGNPIIDASPAIGEALFGVSSAGWSEHASRQLVAELVDSSTPLGPCNATPPDPTPPPDMSQPPTDPGSTDPDPTDPATNPDPIDPPPVGASCYSYEDWQYYADGTCMSSWDGYNYYCSNGDWLADTDGYLCY